MKIAEIPGGSRVCRYEHSPVCIYFDTVLTLLAKHFFAVFNREKSVDL